MILCAVQFLTVFQPASVGKNLQQNETQRSQTWVTPKVTAKGVSRHVFESKVAKTRVSFHVFLPPAYDDNPEKRYLTLYWLHGSGGGLPGIRPVCEFFSAAIGRGMLPPLIIVFPNSFASGMWCDSVDGKHPIESVLVKDIIPEVDTKYRTIANRSGRIVEGFSMGGYGAGRLGFKYPELFGAISMLAAGPLDLEFDGPRTKANPLERQNILESVYGGSLERFKEQSPWRIAKTNAARFKEGTPIRICIGEDDFTLPANKEFSKHLNDLQIPHELIKVPRVGHETIKLLAGLGEKNWEFYRDCQKTLQTFTSQ
jgi:enterochelin esterase-like enzyme